MLSEIQFAQLYYDRARVEIDRLDQDQIVATAVYNAKRKAAEERMDLFCYRLNELETAAKIAQEIKEDNKHE